MRRSGFTLLEVMVATVLTGLVALVAYAAAQVSIESSARLEVRLREVRTDRAARQAVLDLLHNVRAPDRRGDTAFALRGDTLSFIAAGAAPLDPEYDWRVELHPDSAGLVLTASSLGRGRSARVGFTVPGVRRLEVMALALGDPEWRREWLQANALPRGVAVRFWADSEPPGPPLIVRLPEMAPPGPPDFDPSLE